MPNPRTRLAAVAIVAFCSAAAGLTVALQAEDWPQWRGVNRDAIWRDTGIIDRFPEGGLRATWRVPIRGGFAGPAVAGGRVFVLDYQETPGSRTMDGHERLLALDEETGAELWQAEWPATYRNIHIKFANGPRVTPTVDGDHVYILGAAGMLSCFDVATGDLLWRVDTTVDYDVTVPAFGVSQAPLVEGDLLIAQLGGEPDAMVVAFDRATGEERWRAIEARYEPGYSSPIVIEEGGVRQLIVWHAGGVASLDPATGEAWWEYEFVVPSGLTISTPVRSGRYLLVSQIENGGLMLALNPDRPAARPLWEGDNPDRTDHPPQGATLGTAVMADGVMYGLSGYGEFRGVDATTGEHLWSTWDMTPLERWGNSYLVQHEDRVFVINETGELLIARFTPGGYEEIDRTLLMTPNMQTQGGASGRWDDRPVLWAHPAFANQHVVVRNETEVARLSMAASDYE